MDSEEQMVESSEIKKILLSTLTEYERERRERSHPTPFEAFNSNQ